MESNSAIDRSPDELRTGLKTTAVDIGAPEYRQGTGRVDADAAVGAVATSPAITATISAAPDRVTAGRALTVTYTATNSGTERGTATLTLRLNNTVVATTETDTIAPGEQTTETLSYQTTTADTGSQPITLHSPEGTDTKTVRIGEPQVQLSNVTITPSQVSGTTQTHTLTAMVRNVSDDGSPDRITMAMPEQVVVDAVGTTTARDTAGESVPVAGATTLENNTLTVSISPDSNATIRDVTVTTEFSAHRTDTQTAGGTT
jgi:hypothetical protein